MKIIVYLVCLCTHIIVSAQNKNVYVLDNDHIGIGKNNPSQSLEVEGNSQVNGNIIAGENIQISGNLNTLGTIQVDGGDLLPVGSIVMWTSPELPNENWKICDGQYGTLNLTDRFVIGTGRRDDNPDPTQNTYKENFYFKNQGGVPEVALTSKEIPSHKHDIYLSDCSCGKATARGYGGRLPALSNESITYYSDNEGSGYNIDKMEGKPMNNLPPYYTVFFIMKVK